MGSQSLHPTGKFRKIVVVRLISTDHTFHTLRTPTTVIKSVAETRTKDSTKERSTECGRVGDQRERLCLLVVQKLLVRREHQTLAHLSFPYSSLYYFISSGPFTLCSVYFIIASSTAIKQHRKCLLPKLHITTGCYTTAFPLCV